MVSRISSLHFYHQKEETKISKNNTLFQSICIQKYSTPNLLHTKFYGKQAYIKYILAIVRTTVCTKHKHGTPPLHNSKSK